MDNEEIVVKEKRKRKPLTPEQRAINAEKRKKRQEEKREMSPEEIKQLDELSAYVKSEIFGYGDKQALPQFFYFRIASLRAGKIFHSGGMKNTHIYYDLDIILLTFKICKYEILNCLKSMTFNNDAHKINTIMKIIDKNINTVYERKIMSEKAEKKMNDRDMTIFNVAETSAPKDLESPDTIYQRKSKDNTNSELEGLW